jgi:HAE1 family hydrophobic/amphiphilic exporter-1
MKKLTSFSVRYPVTVIMMALAVVLLGYISLTRLGMDLFPDLNNPRLYIELRTAEMPPAEVEQRFVENIESLAIRQKKVVDVTSRVRVGSGLVAVTYAWDADMDEAFLDLQKSLTSFLQNSEIEELTISQQDPNSAPVMMIGLSHPEKSLDELRTLAENYIRNELTRQEGIAAVEVLGAEKQEVVIDTDPLLLAAYGLTPSALSARIAAANVTASGGSIVEFGQKFLIRGINRFSNLDDIGNTVVVSRPGMLPGSDPVLIRLRDVARVSMKTLPPQNIVRIGGEKGLALAVYKETRYNTVRAVEQLREALEPVQRSLPGYEFRIISDQAGFIQSAIGEVEESALLGIMLAVLVLFVFLRRIGTTMIISIAIPISLIATFNLMYFNGLTINIMTLGGLALGAGMLVDNAIVVVENIFRNMENGMDRVEAAIEGTAQVGGAITASTITTIIVFVPIVYLHDAAGELFKEQAWTVAFSLVSSLFVALLMIPMLAARFLPKKATAGSGNLEGSLHFSGYGNLLAKILDRRKLVLAGAVVMLALTAAIFPLVGSEFIPATESRSFRVDLQLPEGTALEQTDQFTAGIETVIAQLCGNDLHLLFARSGPAGTSLSGSESFFEDENNARIEVYLKPESKYTSGWYTEEIRRFLQEYPELQFSVSAETQALESTLGTEHNSLRVEIRGDELDVLQSLTREAAARIDSLDVVFGTMTNFESGRPEITILIDRMRASRYNLTVQDVAGQIRERLQGIDASEAEFFGDTRTITIRMPEVREKELREMLLVAGTSRVRLTEIAQLKTGESAREILRRNQTRVGTIEVQVASGIALDKLVARMESALAGMSFPAEYDYKVAGDEEKRKESFNSLMFALLLSVVLIYMAMASQFESLLHPFTILLTIPLAVVGAVWVFFIAGLSLSIMAYIGIILLAGIAVNDSIILVDAINQLRAESMELREAIIAAGQRRVRPIIMTSLTTILALLPLTFGVGDGAALRAPMALAVVGGLVTSTLLTLVVIPCVYYVFQSAADRFVKGGRAV